MSAQLEEQCSRCAGTGTVQAFVRVNGGRCYACEGTGVAGKSRGRSITRKDLVVRHILQAHPGRGVDAAGYTVKATLKEWFAWHSRWHHEDGTPFHGIG